MKAGIWIRVSTDEQAKGESPQNHEARARYFCQSKKWDVVEKYDLSGVSGKDVLSDSEAKRMLADVATGKIEVLVFSKLARLARNSRQLLEIADYFQKHNANLVSLEESIDTSSAAGRLLYTVIGALAQWEREEIASRVAASVVVRAKMGKPIGGKGPFGYMWQDKQLIINPEEAVIVGEIYQVFLTCRKLLTTAQLMNKKGYRTRGNGEFGKTSIKRILTDATYKGVKRANYSRSKGNKKSWELKPESEWIFVEVAPIVSETTWTEVQGIIQQIEKKYPKSPSFTGKHVFSGTLNCGVCKQKMYVMPYPSAKTQRYRCSKCKAKINEDVLLLQMKDALETIVISPEQLEEVGENDSAVLEQKQNALKLLKTELRVIDKKIDTLLELYSDKAIDKKGFTGKYEILNSRKEQVEEEIPRLEGDLDYLKMSYIGREYVLKQATTLNKLFDEMDYKTKASIIRDILYSVTYNQTENTLHYDFYYLLESESCKTVQTFRDSLRQQARIALDKSRKP